MICGGAQTPWVHRSDGVQVVRCTQCDMGVIDSIPDDLAAFYVDGYYGDLEAKTGGAKNEGYKDYAYTAEHGVSWAAAITQLLRPKGGSVLDIGCADGHLLAKLGEGYRLFGIEANAAAGRIAACRCVTLLGQDLLDPVLTAPGTARFDVVTAIAVFEHLRDIRAGIHAALSLLRDDGVLLFEVPLMSVIQDNTTWLTSSLEHVWYPSEAGLRHLIEAEAGVTLLGRELYITGYASTYVGLAFHAGADAGAVRHVFDAVLARRAEPRSAHEAVARMLTHLIHAFTPTPEDVAALAVMPPHTLNPNLLRRIAEAWQSNVAAEQIETNRVQAAWADRVSYARALEIRLDEVTIAGRQDGLGGQEDQARTLAAQKVEQASAEATRWQAEAKRVQAAWEEQAIHAQALRRRLEEMESQRQQEELTEQSRARRQSAVLKQASARLSRLQVEFDIAVADRVRSCTELVTGIAATQSHAALLQAKVDAHVARVSALEEQEATLQLGHAALKAGQARLAALERTADDNIARAAECERQADARAQDAREWQQVADERLHLIQTMQAGSAWRVVAILRELGHRYPRLVRPARRVVRVLWWTARGRLISRLRLRRQVRLQLQAPAPVDPAPPLPPPAPTPVGPPRPPVPSVAVPRSWEASALRELVLMEATGHRPTPVFPEHEHAAPLVSVIVTSFNYGRFVEDAIDSVLAQTFHDLEVIVVEGGSSQPESRFTVAGLQRPRLRVLMQGTGHRAGANRNFGISQARGRYICCLDADDMLAPTYIEKAVYLLERHGYDVVSSAMEMFGREQKIINIMEQPDLAHLLDGNQVLTCAVFRRTLWEQAGGYRDVDPSVSGYVYEDWAFWVRLAALGARFRNYFHDPMLQYRVHGPSLSREANVMPMWQQRLLVREMNRDVLQDVAGAIERSAQRAWARSGAPAAPPPEIILDGSLVSAPDRPTLLIALPFLLLGGAERLLSNVVGYLVRQGWRVLITTTIRPGPEHGDTTAWFELHTPEIFHLPRGLPPELWEDFFHHLVRSRGVDVLWIAGSVVAYDLLRGLRTAFPALRVADLLFNTVGHTANNRRRRALIDMTFVENTEVRDWLLSRDEVPERLCLMESGVDLEALRPTPRDADLVASLGLREDELLVGFSGRWSEEKNPLGFVEMAQLVDPGLPIRFVMTGTGHMRAAVEQAIAEAGFAAGRFTLLGPVPEIQPVLGSFDLLVLPSILDGRPVVVLEALAMGVPVLASRVGALPEMIEDGHNGWLRDPGNVRGLASCVERAAADRDGLQAMRKQARAYAETALDVRRMLAGYEAGLSGLLPTNG